VCNSIRKDYKDSACCGGNGEAFCAASETLNFTDVSESIKLLNKKIDAITASISNLNVIDSSTTSQTETLFQICYPEGDFTEASTFGIYPPSANPDFYAKDNKINYEFEDGINNLTNPHFTNTYEASDGKIYYYPPFYGLCSTAQSFYRFGIQQCMSNASTCANFFRSADIFSVILQLEFVGNRGTLDFGREYVIDLLTSTPPSQFLTYTLTRPLNLEFTWIMNEFLKTEDTGLHNIWPLVMSSFNTHSLTAQQIAKESGIVEDPRYSMNMVGVMGYKYPENFEICRSSQDMFDYMLQIVSRRYPQIAIDDMFRCAPAGMRLLKIMSIILGYEKSFLGDKTKCTASAKSDIISLIDEFTKNLRRSSEMWQGLAVSVSSEILTAPPTLGQSYFLPGLDAEYMRSFYFSFLQVHVDSIDSACGWSRIEFSDPTGTTQRQMNTASTEFQRIVSAQISSFPTAKPATWSHILNDRCPNYKYGVPSTNFFGMPITPYNQRPIPPLENNCTLANFPYETRYDHYELYYPKAVRDVNQFLDGDFLCEYDPIGRFYNYVIQPANDASFKSLLTIFISLPENPLGFDEICFTDDSQPECVHTFCGAGLGVTSNPESRYTFWFGFGAWIPPEEQTMSIIFAPNCAAANFTFQDPRAVANCAGKFLN
jgi:hypothetical protein